MAQVPDDFGLIECGNCGAQLLVHMDGRVEYSGAKDLDVPDETQAPVEDDPKTHFAFFDPAADLDSKTPAFEPTVVKTKVKAKVKAPAPPPPPPPAEPSDLFDAEPSFLKDLPRDDEEATLPPLPPPLPEEDELDPEFTFTPDEPEIDPNGVIEDEVPFEPTVFQAEPEPEPEPEADFDDATEFIPSPVAELAPAPAMDSFDMDSLDNATEVYQGNAPVADPSDISDIARFGNSDASSSRDGSLRYNITVTGIDTADVRENFREAITDRKLIWDTDQILRSVKNGEVRINNVPAAKAYIFISRLRELPIHVTWEQYAISQS